MHSFGFFVELYQIWLFFSVLCCSNEKNEKNLKKHVSIKTATIFWEKNYIFWQNYKGADIFGHDCKCNFLLYIRCYLYYLIIKNILFVYVSCTYNFIKN